MKKPLAILILISVILITGCSKEIDKNQLVERGGLKYEVNQETPFTGTVISTYDNGQNKLKGSYKDGRQNGLWTEWYANGQKQLEGTFEEGEGEVTYWSEGGIKDSSGSWENGTRSGLWRISWYDNDQVKAEKIFNNGNLTKITSYYKNGQKWEEINTKGIWFEGKVTTWYENGQIQTEEFHRDRRKVRETNYNKDGTIKEVKDYDAIDALAIAKSLIEEREYYDAIKKLKSIISEFSDSQIASEAAYMLGDTYIVFNKNFVEAVGSFREVVRNYPKTKFAMNAQFMIGYVLKFFMGESQQAKKEYQHFLELYSETADEDLIKSVKFELESIQSVPKITDQELNTNFIPSDVDQELNVEAPYRLSLSSTRVTWYEFESDYSGNITSNTLIKGNDIFISFNEYLYLRLERTADVTVFLNGTEVFLQDAPYPTDIMYDSQRKQLFIRSYTPR